jgi:hypothetical protein
MSNTPKLEESDIDEEALQEQLDYEIAKRALWQERPDLNPLNLLTQTPKTP